MKGLEEYVKKHGRHFTEKLANDAGRRKWNAEKIRLSAQKKVYYNVTGSTLGDMVYLMDMFCYHLSDQYTPGKCLKLMLSWVGDYNKTGSPFCIWLTSLTIKEKDFDFTPYI